MHLEVLNIGTELLLGNVTNTHLSYLGRRLFSIGLRIERQMTLPDGSALRPAFLEAMDRCDVLIVTGGLGPTTDDITREIAAELLGLPLQENAEVIKSLEALLARRGIPLRDRMRRQAMVPVGARVLPNANGTAPGLYLPASQTPSLATPHLFFLPGPPRELMPMFEDHVLPILHALCAQIQGQECRTYHVVGMGESSVEEIIGLSLSLRGDVEVGYCARPNEVDLRLIAEAAVLDAIEPDVRAALGTCLVSQQEENLEEVVVNRLRTLGRTLTVAESCTGGLLAHRLTNVPGASEVFPVGYVTYANAMKTQALGVPEELIVTHGAVSEPVALAMAEGALRTAGTDFALAITGLAGPSGGSPEKPVGTVFIAMADRKATTLCQRENFPTDRETFKQLATQSALDLLRRRIFDLQP
jgi:nicotinamide-nucleotide amidase